jgi:hypothetical protein
MRKFLFAGLAVAAIGLGACASEPQWSRSGVSPQTAASDLAECRSMAQTDFRRDANIDADILASRGHDWQQTNTLRTRQAVMSTENAPQSADIIKACMISKGYAPGA